MVYASTELLTHSSKIPAVIGFRKSWKIFRFVRQKDGATRINNSSSFPHFLRKFLMAKLHLKFLQLLLLVFLVQFLGCGGEKLDPALQKAREDTIEIFDRLSAEEQVGFLISFRPSGEAAARATFKGSELDARLKFIKNLEADLKKRQK